MPACRLPPRGTLALEYVNVKVKVHKEVIDAHRLGNFLANLARPRMSDNERLALVAMFIPFHLYTAQQAGEVLAQFGFGEEKVQAALLVTFRYGMPAGVSLDPPPLLDGSLYRGGPTGKWRSLGKACMIV